MVATEITTRRVCQSMIPERSQRLVTGREKLPKKNRSTMPNPAALGPTERSAVTGVAAPW